MVGFQMVFADAAVSHRLNAAASIPITYGGRPHDGTAAGMRFTLLNLSVDRSQLVELKNGETYNGHLVSCDNYMNIILREVTLTSKVRL